MLMFNDISAGGKISLALTVLSDHSYCLPLGERITVRVATVLT
jgi:hypothetical protein